MMFSLRGLALLLALVMPGALVSFAFPPHAVPEGIKRPPVWLVRMERVGQLGTLTALLLGGRYFARPLDAFFVLAMFFWGAHVLLWLRYLVKRRAYRYLYEPFLHIPVPMAVTRGMAVLLLAAWGRFVILGVFAILMLMGQAGSSIYSKDKRGK